MNIHEYQAKKILKDNGAPVSNGFVISEISEIENKLIQLKGKKFVFKSTINFYEGIYSLVNELKLKKKDN